MGRSNALYMGADKSLAQPTSRFILFDGKNVSYDDSLVIYINSINIPPIMILNRIYENQKSSVAVACFLPGWVKDLSAPRCSLFSKISVSNVVYPIKEELLLSNLKIQSLSRSKHTPSRLYKPVS